MWVDKPWRSAGCKLVYTQDTHRSCCGCGVSSQGSPVVEDPGAQEILLFKQ